MANQPHQLPKGHQLKGYIIGDVLAQGGFGITYRAHDQAIGREVAIKEYYPTALVQRDLRTHQVYAAHSAEAYTEGMQRFLHEAEVLARFEHDHIAQIYAFFEANQTSYIVMRLYGGQTLQQWLSRHHPLHEQQAYSILKPILGALRLIHGDGQTSNPQERFIHRDIKPANIQLEERHGRLHAVLLDFGGARQFVADVTHSYAQMLTEGYAPPEQYNATSQQGPYSDIYACAAVMYRMVIGRVPPPALDRLRLEQELAQGYAVSPEVLHADSLHLEAFTPAFARVIAKALALDPEARYSDMDVFVKELEGLKYLTMASDMPVANEPAALSRTTPSSTIPSQHRSSETLSQTNHTWPSVISPPYPASYTPSYSPTYPHPETPVSAQGNISVSSTHVPPSYVPSYDPSYDPHASDAGRGALHIVVQGKPSTSNPGFNITGPQGFSRFLESTITLHHVPAGTYTLKPLIVNHSQAVAMSERQALTLHISPQQMSSVGVGYRNYHTSSRRLRIGTGLVILGVIGLLLWRWHEPLTQATTLILERVQEALRNA